MMYQRTDLTLSMFYASSADADGNKVATLTMQVIAAEAGQPGWRRHRILTHWQNSLEETTSTARRL
ncbi:hypothetical protein NUBL22018_50140 [Klebsiella variicola]|nr:hypothetical protein NUBL22018_50140 [Klebsiella variicola]